MTVKFIDLFAGIGGFHAAASTLDWQCVYACEIDSDAAAIYKHNWGIDPLRDITEDANDEHINVPAHDVLFAGFPCQPFSKSGKQKGMDEARGTLFWNILKIIENRRPSLVLLENVRNIAGPQHKHEWEVIISQLRDLNYRVSDKPFVVSPHRIRRDAGGRPQVRERIFIAATKIPDGRKTEIEIENLELQQDCQLYDPQIWNLKRDLPLQKSSSKMAGKLTDDEIQLIEVWDKLVQLLLKERNGAQLPGFPLWTDFWTVNPTTDEANFPSWKLDFVKKNRNFYLAHKKIIDNWLKENKWFLDLPSSRRKLEWQAQDSQSLWDTIIHFRPSGLRAKKPTYVPALVAITQTSIVASQKRRLTVREAARLQGLPEWFDFANQSDAKSFKQLGNGVSVGAVYQVLRAIYGRDADLLSITQKEILKTLRTAPLNPDQVLLKKHYS